MINALHRDDRVARLSPLGTLLLHVSIRWVGPSLTRQGLTREGDLA